MAFLFCMTMVSGSYAAASTTITQSQFFYSGHLGDKVEVTAGLMGPYCYLPWRYLDFTLYNNKGEEVWAGNHKITNFKGIARVTIDTNSLGAGNYKLKIKYGGSSLYKSHETGETTFDVYDNNDHGTYVPIEPDASHGDGVVVFGKIVPIGDIDNIIAV